MFSEESDEIVLLKSSDIKKNKRRKKKPVGILERNISNQYSLNSKNQGVLGNKSISETNIISHLSPTDLCNEISMNTENIITLLESNTSVLINSPSNGVETIIKRIQKLLSDTVECFNKTKETVEKNNKISKRGSVRLKKSSLKNNIEKSEQVKTEEPILTEDTFKNTTEPLEYSCNFDDEAIDEVSAECKTKVIFRRNSEETVFYLNMNDTLESVFDRLCIDDDTKIRYKGIPVSKYLTLEDIGFSNDHLYFDVISKTNNIENHKVNEDSKVNLRINIDFNKSVVVSLDKSRSVKDIFSELDFDPQKEGKLVLNGVLLDTNLRIQDILEMDDVIDYV